MRTVADTLEEALSLSAALEPPALRRARLLALALAARDHEQHAIGDAAALLLDTGAAQLPERALRLERALASPEGGPRLRALAEAVADALARAWPWRPGRLTHPDEARVLLCSAWARLGEDSLLDDALGGFVAHGLHALGWAAACAASWGRSPERAEALSYHALTLAVRAEDRVIERRTVRVIAEGALVVGRTGAALAPLKALSGLGVFGLRWAEAALVVAQACAENDELGAAGATLQRAALAAEEVEGADQAVTALLCRVAEAQRRHLGPALARTTAQRIIDRLRGHVIGPEPNLRLPFRPLLEVSLANPGLAAPLRDLLRRQAVVAPGWCFALGLLELGTGAPERARQAARVLEESADSGANDVEARWLGGLLRARLGELPRARRQLLEALRELPAGAAVDVPGSPGGDRRAERVFTDELLAAGDLEGALLIARLTPGPALRGALLRRCADALRLRGELGAAHGALDEATAALAEEEAADLDPELLLELVLARAGAGQEQAAADLFAWERARLVARGDGAAQLPLAQERLGGRCGAGVDAALERAWEEELAALSAPDDQIGLLLAWLEAQRGAGLLPLSVGA
jgi:hypothetical protein